MNLINTATMVDNALSVMTYVADAQDLTNRGLIRHTIRDIKEYTDRKQYGREDAANIIPQIVADVCVCLARNEYDTLNDYLIEKEIDGDVISIINTVVSRFDSYFDCSEGEGYDY